MPLISIITPAYNATATIEETIRSVQLQDFLDWEMIVIDDCSDDGTGALVEAYAADDNRIRLIRRAENAGPQRARNKGLDIARGQYIAFLDADDVWLPGKLSAQYDFMQQTQAAITCTAYRRLYAGNAKGRILRAPPIITFDKLLRRNPVALLTAMIDRQRVPDIRFREDVGGYEDYALWLELTKAGHDIVFINQDLARYRVLAQDRYRRKIRNQFWKWYIFRRIAGLKIRQSFVSLLTFMLYGIWKRAY